MPDAKIMVEPFTWNDNFSELAMEDFDIIRSQLPYRECQSIGMALAKLQKYEALYQNIEDLEHILSQKDK